MLSEFEDMQVVGEAGNGQELLDLLKDTFPEVPDVILLDLKMPVMDGMEALKKIREQYADLKVIILSMYEDEKFILHLVELGANAYLLKNAEPEDVQYTIHKVIEQGYCFNDEVTEIMRKGLINKTQEIPRIDNKVQLTPRELEVITLICQEYTNAEIAEKLFLSPRTIEGYRNKLLEKLGVKNTAGIVRYAVTNGIVS